MDNYKIIFKAVGIGCLISLCSMLLGIKISNSMGGEGKKMFSTFEPKGDVFTVDDVDDIPFPDDSGSGAEAHVQGRANKFTEMFNEESK